LTTVEKKLVVLLLRMASEEFGNHGCNDFNLVKDGKMTAKEADALMKSFHVWNGSPGDYEPGDTNLGDFVAMDYLADLLEREAKEESKKEPKKGRR
jgi:hypothetical protein